MFNKKETINIYCGTNVFAHAIILGFIGIAQALWDWRHGMLFVIFGSIFVFWIDVKKYRFIKQQKIVSFFRSVVIDSSCLVLSYIGMWMNLFVPDPFSLEEFLQPSDAIIIPVGGWIIGGLLAIPLICTNKRILKSFQS